eukprot:COSAG02_NODE_81_length_39811_cov_51.728898_10_plen_50_part_00
MRFRLLPSVLEEHAVTGWVGIVWNLEHVKRTDHLEPLVFLADYSVLQYR